MTSIRILLADDHTVMRGGLRLLLERQPNLEVVGEAADGRQAVDLAAAEKPNVVVMDIAMPNLNGVEATRLIVNRNPDTAVEALTPDFQGVLRDVETVVDSGLQVFAQNVETVHRLTHPVRDPRAGYEQTLKVLAHAKRHKPAVLTKTSLMLGLGETFAEIVQTFDDLRAAGVDLLTLGQYLRPTLNHLPVERFVSPAEFAQLREAALARGFVECVAGPFVRSSYRAEQALNRNNAGLG